MIERSTYEALHTTALACQVAKQMNNPEEIGVVELSFARMLQDEDPSAAMMWLLRAKEPAFTIGD